MRDDRYHRQRGLALGNSSVVFGLVIVAVGLVLLLQNMGILHHNIWAYWPVILILVGGARLLDARSTGAYVWGGTLVLVGLFFLLDNLGILYFNFNLLWPVLLIGLGISMFFRAFERKRLCEEVRVEGVPTDLSASNSTLSHFAVFGGVKRRVETKDFRGGDLLAIFGGIELDFTHSEIPNGQAVIDANAMFGGIDLRVPEAWTVEVKGTGIFGGYEDKTFPPRPGDPEKAQKLILTGYAIFGGINVKN